MVIRGQKLVDLNLYWRNNIDIDVSGFIRMWEDSGYFPLYDTAKTVMNRWFTRALNKRSKT